MNDSTVEEKEQRFFVVWKVTCMKEHKTFIIIDEGNDLDFQCEICSTESNHLPPDKDYYSRGTDKYRQGWLHYKELVGRVSYMKLKELAVMDQRGWRDV